MKLTPSLLLEQLETAHFIARTGLLSGAQAFGRPLLYEKGKPYPGNHFLIARAEEADSIPLHEADTCLVLLSIEEDNPFSGDIPFLMIRTQESTASIMNCIQEIFDRFDEWQETLEQIRNRRGSVREYLVASHSLFSNPLCIMGTDFRLKEEVGVESLPERARIFSRDWANMEYVNALKHDPAYNQMQSSREVILYPEYITGYRSLNMNLWDKDACRYRFIVLEHGKKLTEGDRCLVQLLAPYLRYAVYHQERITEDGNNSLRRIFNRILTDRTADYTEISRQLTTFGWSAASRYLCLVFQITYLDQVNLTVGAICAYMEKNYPGACSFPFHDEIVTFFNLGPEAEGLEALEGKLKYFIRESFLKAGYSWVMAGHGDLRRQYVQAQITLDVGSRMNPYLWIHHFQEIAFPYILEQSARRLPGYMLIHERLRLLQESDAQQGTEYMKTLRVYLDEQMNAMRTAKKLFIHRSTFLYRLDKIKLLLESGLDDPEEVLYLNYSFRLLEKEMSKN